MAKARVSFQFGGFEWLRYFVTPRRAAAAAWVLPLVNKGGGSAAEAEDTLLTARALQFGLVVRGARLGERGRVSVENIFQS